MSSRLVRWRSDRRIATAMLAAALMLPGAADAAEIVTLRPDLPVESLARENGPGAGIAQPAGAVTLSTTDGNRMRLVRRDGMLALEAASPAPAPQTMPDMVPDSIVTRGSENIRHAWLTGPTERYAHGVLGDTVEGGGLALERFDGRVFRFATDSGSVFEDRLARLADLDGDGWDEVIVVQSYLDRGAALAMFALGADAVRFVSEVPPIGTPNRWLNPAGVADYDGDGRSEIAYVETPHIGGMLRLYALEDRRLVADHAIGGFSNHAIGSRIQDMAATLDWDGDGVPDLALPDAQRRSLRVIGFAGGEPRELARIQHPVPIVSAVLPALLADGEGVSVVYGLADGTLVAVRP